MSLILNEIGAYEAIGSNDDRGGGYVIGYFLSHDRAVQAAKGKGWWTDGTVKYVMIHTDGDKLYNVESLGEFIDQKQDHEKWLTERITSKLTAEELEFLGLNKN